MTIMLCQNKEKEKEKKGRFCVGDYAKKDHSSKIFLLSRYMIMKIRKGTSLPKQEFVKLEKSLSHLNEMLVVAKLLSGIFAAKK